MIHRESQSRKMRSAANTSSIAVAILLSAIPLKGFADGQASAQPAQQSDPIAVFTDYDLPPSTLEAAWGTVPIIVLARVQSSVVRERVTRGNLPVPYTEHQVIVQEVFKGSELLGAVKSLTVDQSTVEASATLSRAKHESGGRVFKAPEEYVLFLEPLSGRAAFGVAWGAGGAYKVGQTTVDVPGVARKMWGYREEISRHEIISALRGQKALPRSNKRTGATARSF